MYIQKNTHLFKFNIYLIDNVVELLPTKLMKPLPEKKYFDMHAH